MVDSLQLFHQEFSHRMEEAIKRNMPRSSPSEPQIEQAIDHLGFTEPPAGYRDITEEERQDYLKRHFDLVQDRAYYDDQEEQVDQRYREIKKTLKDRKSRTQSGIDQVGLILSYGKVPTATLSVEQQRARKETVLLTPSQELRLIEDQPK